MNMICHKLKLILPQPKIGIKKNYQFSGFFKCSAPHSIIKWK
jgi:hypothetical protein